jgi:hypothetical protein
MVVQDIRLFPYCDYGTPNGYWLWVTFVKLCYGIFVEILLKLCDGFFLH